MELYNSTDEIKERRLSAVALGYFDGLHLGHAALISECVAFAEDRELSADVFTFNNHPKNVMSGEMQVPRLMPEQDKLSHLSTIGINRVFNFDFADNFHTMPPEEFASKLLVDAFAAKAVFCGFNFRFGADQAGDPEMLTEFGKKLGFRTYIIDPIYVGDHLASSTLIRRCINTGQIDSAGRLLGRDYVLRGTVDKGSGLGRDFGFPTANFYPDKEMTLPALGVYITETLANGVTYPSVTNVGVRPTIDDDSPVRVETHLLNADLTLYDKEIAVFFKKMLRKEYRFEDEEALKQQISADAANARAFFSN